MLDGVVHRRLHFRHIPDVGLETLGHGVSAKAVGLGGRGVQVEVEQRQVGTAAAQRVGKRGP